MGTITAQLLIGESHPNHGGVYPTHVLYLSEQSGASWILTEHRILVAPPANPKPVIWIPTWEHMLEDALLMISYYVWKDPHITKAFHEHPITMEQPCVTLSQHLDREQLAGLYAINQQVESRQKLMVNVFAGSTIRRQLPVLEKYAMEVEVTVPVFSRTFSRGRNEMVISGSLQTEM